MTATHIALILWRTPAHAQRYIRQQQVPAPGWRDMLAAWLPVPIWARQHPLLECMMRLPVQQRYALLQLTFPHILGLQKNPRALYFALRACGRVLFPDTSWADRVPLACAQYQPLLASGQLQSLQGHLRQCIPCQQRVRLFASVRNSVIATIASMQLPHIPSTPPAHLLSRMGMVLIIVLCFIVPLWAWTPPLLQLRTVQVAPLLEGAYQTLYQPPPLTDGMQWHQRYEIFWKFADGSVTLLDGDVWYSQAPDQYRVQLAHYTGGSPYELDIATQAFRLYVVTESYAADVWPPSNTAARIIMPMAGQLPETALVWRLKQGAWGMPYRVLDALRADTTTRVIGNTVADDGTALVRLQNSAWWADIDPQSGRLYAIWQRTQPTPQRRWQLRWSETTPVVEDGTFLITQPQNGLVESRSQPAIHPALPRIAMPESIDVRGDTVRYLTASARCEATLNDAFVARCRDVNTGRETVYTVGENP